MNKRNDEEIIDVEIEEVKAEQEKSAESTEDTQKSKTNSKVDNLLAKLNNHDAQEEIETSMSMPVKVGLSIVFAVFGVMLIWSILAPLDSSSMAPGVVVVEGHRKVVQHLDGGIIDKMAIKDGQLVNKGDVLFELDKTQLQAQLDITQSQYNSLLGLSDRLMAEHHAREQIDFSEHLLERLSDPTVQEVQFTQQQVFSARKNAREGEISLLQQRIKQLDEQTSGLRALQQSQKKQIDLYRGEINEFKALLKKGFADKSRMREMQRRVAELEGEVAKNQSNIASAKIQKSEAELEIIQINKKFQLDVSERLSETSVKINEIKERITAIQDKLDRTTIVAPVSGMIINLAVHTIGGVITPGNPILEIVPQEGQLLIEAEVSPMDIDKIHKGLVSEVRFSSFKMATTPVIDGEVLSVSPDRLVNKQTGMPYYLCRVKITAEGYKNLGELVLLPGMPADVLIKIGERTVFEYLIQPLSNAFAHSFNED